MAKYSTYKYEFDFDSENFLLAIGESALTKKGLTIKIHKFNRNRLLEHLWYSFDGGNWTDMEMGYRTETGQYRENFKKWKMNYLKISENKQSKLKEIPYQRKNAKKTIINRTIEFSR